VPSADVQLVSNTPSVRNAKVGDTVEFTVVARNNGPDPVQMTVYPNLVALWDLLPGAPTPTLVLSPLWICDLGQETDADGWCEYGHIFAVGETVTTRYFTLANATGEKLGNVHACTFSPSLPGDEDLNPANDCLTATVKIVGKRK
jgi:uncharacterized repeat protein (TIGR01451 family)